MLTLKTVQRYGQKYVHIASLVNLGPRVRIVEHWSYVRQTTLPETRFRSHGTSKHIRSSNTISIL